MRTPGYGITPDRFVRVAHLLPRQCGNVAVDNHTFVNALLCVCVQLVVAGLVTMIFRV